MFLIFSSLVQLTCVCVCVRCERELIFFADDYHHVTPHDLCVTPSRFCGPHPWSGASTYGPVSPVSSGPGVEGTGLALFHSIAGLLAGWPGEQPGRQPPAGGSMLSHWCGGWRGPM